MTTFHPTEDEQAMIIHRYTKRGHSLDTIARDYHRDAKTMRRIITTAGHTIRTPGRQPIDPTLPLNQPHIAYCALCEQKALYVFTETGAGGGYHDGGHILEIEPHPKGRWKDRGDGIYQRSKTPILDGTGHRGHACGKHHAGRRAHDNVRKP